jgi:hypothetical protein
MALTQVQGGMILASGQSIPKAALPTGSVLQVVNATYATSISTSSTSYSDTGLSATITPSSTSSKILVFVDITGTQKGGLNGSLGLQLVRNSTAILYFEGLALYTAGTVTSNAVGACSTNYLDSPATTSATTYKVQYKAFEGTVYVNSVYTGSPSSSTITLMEIAG